MWIAAWWAVTALQLVDPLFLPSPGAVVRRFGMWLRDGGLLKDAGISIFRVTTGFLLSAAIALPLGLVIGAYRPVRAFFEPLLEFARYLPAVAFVPMVLLWTGIGESSNEGGLHIVPLRAAKIKGTVPLVGSKTALISPSTRKITYIP